MSQQTLVPSPASIGAAFSMNGPVVETDPTQRKAAMIAHLCGIAGILGTGIFYLVKKNDVATGNFPKQQVKDAFNFHCVIAALWFVLIIALTVVAMIVPALAMIFSLAFSVVGLGVLALVIVNALKANKGIAGVYPISFPILK